MPVEVLEYNRPYRGKPVEAVMRDAATVGSQREVTIPQSEHIEKLEERIEKLEAALRDVVRCLIDGSVDINKASSRSDTFHEHRILGVGSVLTMVEVYRRLEAQMGDPGYDIPLSEYNSINEQAVALIVGYGGIDGAQHKQWVLDQVLRLLAGETYEEIIAQGKRDGYSWSEGIAP